MKTKPQLPGILMLAFSWFSYQCSGQVTEQLLKAFPGESGDRPYWLIEGLDGGLYGTLHNGGRTNGGAVFRINKDATEYKLLHTFGRFAGDGQIPGAGITQGADGSLYGATSAGGTSGFGTIFRLATNGIDYQVLYSFNTNDGHSPSPVIQGSDGALYGTCNSGGLYGYGTIFRITTNGGNFVVLHNFDPGAGDGEYPQAALVQGRDSALYGTTWWDGISGKGNIFKINPDGAGYAVIHNFGSVTNDGANCTAPLIQAADGALYGSCEQGGNRSVGTVFKVNLDGTGYGILHHFGSTGDGQNPYAPLLQATNGMLYGTTTFGGSKRVGTIFQITTNGTVYTIQHSFTGSGGDGEWPYYAGLIQCADGMLYGASADGGVTAGGGEPGLGALFKFNPDGSAYTPFYSFTASGGDAQSPYAGLIQANDGFLYGTTLGGGNAGTLYSGIAGSGTVFRISTNGEMYSVIYRFSANDGENPYAGVIQGQDGFLYGTTYNRGSNGQGTVFKLSLDVNSFSVLHDFTYTSTRSDGQQPQAQLLQTIDGRLYGTTTAGGVSNLGTIFALQTDGTGYLLLHNFGVTSGDGESPQAALVQGNDSALYGTCYSGGLYGYGTVFKIATDGSGYETLHSFPPGGGTDGHNPIAALLQATDGSLYGTTSGGGTNGTGTVFKLSPDGTGYAVLINFGVATNDAVWPAGLIQGGDTALYGTSRVGGNENWGAVFKINTDGSGYAVLHGFTPSTGDGAFPAAKLLQGRDGAMYGTTQMGSDLCAGSVFRIAGPALPPLALTSQPTSVTNALGSAAMFDVAATSTLPLGYQWMKNGHPIIDAPNISGSKTATLSLSSLAFVDSGIYAVVVTNELGGVMSAEAVLIVVEPPRFTSVRIVPNRGVELSLVGTSNVVWRVETSTNLVDWVNITNMVNPTGTVQFSDWDSTNFNRFYRAVWVQ